MARHQEAFEGNGEDPLWILTDPSTLVRFDPGARLGKWARYNELGAVMLVGPIDAQRLRTVNLNRLAYLDPRYTPLPRWMGTEPPTLTDALTATIDIDETAEDLTHPDAPWPFCPFDDPRRTLTALYEPWARGEMNEAGAVEFLRSVQLSAIGSGLTDEDWSIAVSIGIRLVAPVTSSPVKTLAAAIDHDANYARQVMHRLRQGGLVPPPLRDPRTALGEKDE